MTRGGSSHKCALNTELDAIRPRGDSSIIMKRCFQLKRVEAMKTKTVKIPSSDHPISVSYNPNRVIGKREFHPTFQS